ncbi:VOC family protein [Microlunatus flavus]|uniref:VOC family protein n=1 Tax=Microlunatus flavus TaxID=1036181 RepID=UPI001E2F095D|nr:VOC family protein [Microlunatus flavus]
MSGIGGFFFRAREPERLAAWYAEHLGVDGPPAAYGDPSWRQEAGPTVFFGMDDPEHLGGPDRTWSMNFRVPDLEAMVAQLRAAGIEVEVDPETYPNGTFASLRDPEGNVLQLWEPGGVDAEGPVGTAG